jgi:hypothetical protein
MAGNVLFMLARFAASALSLVLEFWLASHVSRFYIDGRKSGFLELLLVTPITQADILQGHWLALRRLFLPPVAAQLLLTLVFGAIQLWASSTVVLASPPAGTTMPPTMNHSIEIAQVISLVLGPISWCLGLFTIVWFSIWMGMTSKRIPIAMLKTFWYAKILPWFGISLASGILLVLVERGFNAGSVVLFYSVVLQLLFIGVNLALITLARRRAQETFAKWANSAVV